MSRINIWTVHMVYMKTKEYTVIDVTDVRESTTKHTKDYRRYDAWFCKRCKTPVSENIKLKKTCTI